jgi:hypothetical protein
LPSYAVAELLKAVAVIYKRGKKCSPDVILTLVTDLLNHSSDALQALGLRIIEVFCLEHATFWRSTITMSCQQHQMAKKRFEDSLLKKFFELSLGRLADLRNNADTVTVYFLKNT